MSQVSSSRQVPRWRDLEPFLRPRPVERDAVRRRLSRCLSVDDVERLARRRVPGAVWDYVAGGSDSELAMRRNGAAFDRIELMPTTFGQVAAPDTSATLLGRSAAAPIVLAPTGYTRLSHHTGERAAAVAAEQAGLPYTLSTYATTSITDVARAAPGGRNWFQVYLMKDRAVTRAHLDEAREQGYEALVLTIDTTVTGMKRKGKQNGFAIPPQLTARTMAGMARHPGWVADILTTQPLRFATFSEGSAHARWGMSNELREQEIRPADITWLREEWGGPVVVKGVQSVVDAVAAVGAGADAIVLSNHGGRQLDRAPVPFELLPAVVEAVAGRAEVYVDSGVRSGGDVVAAVALGATGVMVGRAYLYGLMVGGQRGVTHVLDVLTDEMRRAMGMLGTPTLAHLTPEHARLRDR
ncbi:alpha-hydroxy-acid oxidizing protein [Nocardioides cavernae]|uniref:Alpha-hydroxy-acid oxidizing protein n=1 Tax=Nocardioides cavernae TaxID=1921566 RepID=A0ABR8N614_9ACTN|nr:alpha-hydroxy acid oxidase [Nocardioides cavernae]MBD3923597.1 alpha-hydroxy-acid oxidizing protein [Nocardioides cavernae]MBM7511474.1 L-lactate dehydrogenase (cytochrome) [Nocardioides cavernae]